LNLTEKAGALLEKTLEITPQIENSGWHILPEMDKLNRIVQQKRIAQSEL